MIKRLIFKVLIMLAIAAGIMSYFAAINGIDIRQFMPTLERPQLPSFKLPVLPDIKLPAGGDGAEQSATISKIYKWRGDDGSWHFSETLPEGVTPEKVIFLNAETNVVQGLPERDNAEKPIAPIKEQPATLQSTPPVNHNPYSQQAIEQLLNDARGVQKIMDQRNQELEQAIQSR